MGFFVVLGGWWHIFCDEEGGSGDENQTNLHDNLVYGHVVRLTCFEAFHMSGWILAGYSFRQGAR